MNKFDIYSDFVNNTASMQRGYQRVGQKVNDMSSNSNNKRGNGSSSLSRDHSKKGTSTKSIYTSFKNISANNNQRSVSNTRGNTSTSLSHRNNPNSNSKSTTFESHLGSGNSDEIKKKLRQREIEQRCEEYSKVASKSSTTSVKLPIKEKYNVHDLYKSCVTSEGKPVEIEKQSSSQQVNYQTHNYNTIGSNERENSDKRKLYYQEEYTKNEKEIDPYRTVGSYHEPARDYLATQNSTSINNKSKYDVSFNLTASEKMRQLLNDKIKITKLNIMDYELEKEKLEAQIYNKINTQEYKKIEMIDQEIKYFQNLTKSCIKSSSQLTEEIMLLKKELAKFGIGSIEVDSENSRKRPISGSMKK